MIPYCTRTGTISTLAELEARAWGLLLSAKGRLGPLDRWSGRRALDNGAWWSFQHGQPFDEVAFGRAVDLFGEGSDFIVVPDIVAGGRASLDLSLSWLDRLKGVAPLLLAVQNGIEEADVAPLLGPQLGIFVGGSTEWKLATMAGWARLAHAHGAWVHVARVNTQKRIRRCAAAGADSFDGASGAMFPCSIPALDTARRQTDLEGFIARRSLVRA